MKELVNIGSAPDAGDGDKLRVAFQKLDDDLNELYGPTGVAGYRFFPLQYPLAPNAVELYRTDSVCPGFPRQATISAIAGDKITLTAAVADQFFGVFQAGCTYARVWNMSKAPNQPAWVKAQTSSSQLQVIDASAIVTWANGDTLQVGDANTPGAPAASVVALDVSPLLLANFGFIFRQGSLVLSSQIIGATTAGNRIDCSPTAALGTFIGLPGTVQVAGVITPGGTSIVACSQLSPISNSNLVFLRETFTGSEGSRLVRAVGVFV